MQCLRTSDGLRKEMYFKQKYRTKKKIKPKSELSNDKIESPNTYNACPVLAQSVIVARHTVNISTVIQVRGLATNNTGFNISIVTDVSNLTVSIHSFDVFENLIMPFVKGISVLNVHFSSVFLLFLVYL